MNIAIICGSMEPGKDGVGDYTRRLAGELTRNGHSICIIALNDRHIKVDTSETQQVDGTNLQVIRIAASVVEKERFSALKVALAQFNPQWISLQFVPYSFNIKGLPYSFFSQLAQLKTAAKWHIMFHEIWLDQPERVNQQIVKLLQKAIIYIGIKKLKPRLVNVSLLHNQHRLQSIGCKSAILPLFGNIPFSAQVLNEQLLSAFKDAQVNILYFGGAPRHKYLTQVITGIENFCKERKDKVNIIVASGNSADKDNFISELNGCLSAYGARVIDVGFVETAVLSNLLSACSVGIVRSEPYFLGKSGSAIAMLEHGLPVWLPKWTGNEAVDYDFRSNLIHAGIEGAVQTAHEPYHNLLPGIAQSFLRQLTDN